MKIKFIIVGICCALVSASCKKYENGPAVSVIPKKIRVVNIWSCKEFLFNGADGSQYTTPDQIHCEFDIDGSARMDLSQGSYYGTWEFDNKKKDIKFTPDNGNVKVFHILKLKERELWFYEMIGSDKYEYHFKSAYTNTSLLH